MQIFGQNIFGVYGLEDLTNLYSGEISIVLDRIVKTLLSVTKQQRLCVLSLNSTSTSLVSGNLSMADAKKKKATLSLGQTSSLHGASLYIE